MKPGLPNGFYEIVIDLVGYSSDKNVKISPANLDSTANITNHIYIAGHGWGEYFYFGVN